MPNFNYENPRNVYGASMESPDEYLLLLILEKLAYEGYSGISYPALLEAGADEEIISSMRDREELCRWAIEEAAERIRLSYINVTEDALEYLKSTEKNRDSAVMQLERLLYRHIYLCFHPKNRSYVLAVSMESQLPKGINDILPKTVNECFVKILADMILEVSDVRKPEKAAMLAVTTCTGINAFAVQPELCKCIYYSESKHKPNYAVIEDQLNNYYLRAIMAETAINKFF